MAILFSSTPTYSSVVKMEFKPELGYCKKMVTLNGPAATLAIGTVLGLVTATGKYKVVEATAVDGSQVAAAVIVGNAYGQPNSTVVAANTDTKFLVLYRGPCYVADASLVYGASVTAGALQTTAKAQLAAAGIDPIYTV